MFHLREYQKHPERLSDYLPWAALIAPGVILQKDSVFQKTVAFRGPDLATASPGELVSATARLNNLLKRLGSGWALHVEAQRYFAGQYPAAEWPHAIPQVVDAERRGHYEAEGQHYDSSYFLTLSWQLPGTRSKKLESLFVDDPREDDPQEHNRRDLDYFLRFAGQIIDILSTICPTVSELNDDETLSYVHSTISMNWHPIKCPETPMYLDALLPDQVYQSGEVAVLGDHYVMTATIMGFPGEDWPGILDDLNHLAVSYRWSQRFVFLDQEEAQQEIKKYRKWWWSKRQSLYGMLKEQASGQEALGDPEAVANAAECDAALQDMGKGTVGYGYYTTTVTVWDRDLDEVERKMGVICKVLNSRGFATKIETWNSFHAWLSSLPGQVYANIRRPLLSTLNLARLFPLAAIWSGDRYDEHLKKKTGYASPLMITNSTGRTPFRLSLAVGDVGHTFIAGPTGSGKTTLLGMMALQWLRYPHAQVFIFDRDRSARALTMAVGGHYYEPGNPDRPVSFQPLGNIDQEKELQWAVGWAETLFALQAVELDPFLRRDIFQALQNLATSPKEERTISGLKGMLQEGILREALTPFTLDGPYGQILDGNKDELDIGQWTMLETGALMSLGERAMVPAIGYQFHRLEQRFGQGPTFLYFDEGWLYLKYPYFIQRLEDWFKTTRKKDVYMVFGTTELEDAVKSPICSTLYSACQTKIFLPNPQALDPIARKMYSEFGLSEAEIETIARATPKREYYLRSPKGRRVFDLELGPVALAIVARSSTADQAFLDGMEEKLPKEEWGKALLEDRHLHWAVELMKDWEATHLPQDPAEVMEPLTNEPVTS
ncbi:MAG: conjugal transfer protein TrbE [Nitrospirales bacterium]|nr:conjugal transfer protein TrbE [Nitrospirales bacterium]